MALDQQRKAVASGHWPLLRYNPVLRKKNQNPFVLDSARPTIPLKDYAYNELRYKVLTVTNPESSCRVDEACSGTGEPEMENLRRNGHKKSK